MGPLLAWLASGMWLWLRSNPWHRWAQVSRALGGAARGAQKYGSGIGGNRSLWRRLGRWRRVILYVRLPGMDG
jgi:hypothetical protein